MFWVKCNRTGEKIFIRNSFSTSNNKKNQEQLCNAIISKLLKTDYQNTYSTKVEVMEIHIVYILLISVVSSDKNVNNFVDNIL